MTSQPGHQKITIHIFYNISRSKGNPTMKFGQLIEYNMTIILLEKSYSKYGTEKLVPDFFVKNQNYAYLWINKANAAEITHTDCTSTS